MKHTVTVTRTAAVGLGLAAALALGACSKSEEAAPEATPEAVSTDFVAENPTEPAVPVDLPTTPMTSAPVSEAAPAPSASAAQ